MTTNQIKDVQLPLQSEVRDVVPQAVRTADVQKSASIAHGVVLDDLNKKVTTDRDLDSDARPVFHEPIRPGAIESLPKHVVAIGASARDLKALEKFFSAVPSDSGFAFVVIQRFSPNMKILTPEILERYTSIPVQRVTDGITLTPNYIYLAMPRPNLVIEPGRIRFPGQDRVHVLQTPLNACFRSLAQAYGEHAIGIILSGAGSDGAEGARLIKEAGGVIMVQDQRAEFGAMLPDAAATHLADHILPPEAMPQKFLTHFRPLSSLDETPPFPNAAEPHVLRQILGLLQQHCALNFRHYRSTTIVRRVRKRMMMCQMISLDEYLAYLQQTPEEVRRLGSELLINVTGFFRDPDAFEYLAREVLAPLLKRSTDGEPVRMWTAACATGEEAYSLAMLVHEQLDHLSQPIPVKILATDVDAHSIERASQGVFSATSLSGVSPERLKRFFTREGSVYRISHSVRNMVIFAKHNIIQDTPFTKLDLISCRNLLIYFEPLLQKRVLSMLHYALKPEGFLFLGASESVGERHEGFALFDGKHKLYRKQGNLPFPRDVIPRLPRLTPADEPATSAPPTPINKSVAEELPLMRAYKLVMNTLFRPGLLLNSRFEVLHIFGRAGELLRQPGEATLNSLRLLPTELSLPLTTALQSAAKTHKTVRYTGIRAAEVTAEKTITLEVQPLLDSPAQDPFFIVFFKDGAPSPTTASSAIDIQYDASEQQRMRIADLEHQLQKSTSMLQATIEKLSTINEELQATNEELEASNEELQSANEELQAVNEELTFVNSDYQNKILELTELHSDLDNLLRSTTLGTLFLDTELRIRKFTPAVTSAINLVPHDIGCSIEHFALNFICPSFHRHLKEVLQTRTPVKDEVFTVEGSCLLMHILPYQDATNEAMGIIVTFLDISDRKKTEAELHAAKEAAEAANRTKGEFLATISHELRTPLNVIMGYLDILLEGAYGSVTDEQRKRLQRVQWNARGLFELISTVLEFNHLEAKLVTAEITKVDMTQFMALLKEGVRELCDQAGIECLWRICEPLPCLYTARDKLQIICNNLIRNAVKFTEKGYIQVTAQAKKGGIEIIVTDTGIGIPRESLPMIFDAFYQVRSADTRQYSGVGLGLHIVKHFVDMLHGSITVESEPGNGSTFRVWLPTEKSVSSSSDVPKLL